NDMRVMLEASTGRCKHLWLDASICRHMGRPACLSIRLDAIGDAEAFGLQPTYLPGLMCRTPHGAESLCAFAQFEFAVGDAHRHDVLVARRGRRLARRHGTDSTISSTAFNRRSAFSSYR